MQEANTEKFPIVVLISGNGSNLQAIIDATERGLPIEIRAVISNEPDAYGLERARAAEIPAHTVPHRNFSTRQEFDEALRKQIECYQPALVVLAGFMRRLESAFVQHFQGRMINIHPSLLPKYPGLNTYQRVLEAGDKEHGSSIHFVTDDVDGGPLICQAPIKIKTNDTETSLKEQLQKIEHMIYPQVLSWFAKQRIALKEHSVLFDGQPLPPTGKILAGF